MTFVKTLALAAALATPFVLGSVPASAGDVTVGDLTLSNAWTRATPPRAMAGGGFVTITNAGAADRLVAASAPVSEKTELHEMVVTDGVMKMREMEGGIEIPAGGTVDLKPGGLHVMFMGLKAPIKEGETVPVTLTFENAGTVEVSFTAEKIGAKGMGMGTGGGMNGTGMKHGQSKN